VHDVQCSCHFTSSLGALQVLGTPSKEDILGMNPNYNEFRFPQIKSHPWSEVFEPAIEPEAVELISGLLKYSPVQRFTGVQAMGHPFFAEILKPECTLPNGVHALAALRVCSSRTPATCPGMMSSCH
jgi:serine/threonine protein kinase